MDSLLKVAGQMVGGKGQSQGQGPSSGTSGLMHKITDVATGQSHPGDQRNQQPRAGQYESDGAYGQMMGGPYPASHQERPGEGRPGFDGPGYPHRDEYNQSGYEQREGSRENYAPYYGGQGGHGQQPGPGYQPGPYGYGSSDRNHGFEGPRDNYRQGDSYEQRGYEQHGREQGGHEQYGREQRGHEQYGREQGGHEQYGREQRGHEQQGKSSGRNNSPYGRDNSHGYGKH